MSSFFKKLLVKLNKIKKNFQSFFLLSICSFFIGFYLGNLFGTTVKCLKNKTIWEGNVLIIIGLFFEIFNFILYNKYEYKYKYEFKLEYKYKKLLVIIKNFQIGFILGFFVDAFKVGS